MEGWQEEAHWAGRVRGVPAMGVDRTGQLARRFPTHSAMHRCGTVRSPAAAAAAQVLDSKTSYPAAKFMSEGRFESDRRESYHRKTPGPGAYRV